MIRPGGKISQHLKGFEAREQQQRMMRDVVEAYNESKIALIEAGTGTGKSMAYLLPAILWAAKYQERTVISTHTIPLQEQLVQKDIPLLLKALGLDLKAVLVKGMGNYVCMRKFDDHSVMLPTLSEKDAGEMAVLQNWLSSTSDGSRSDMPIVPSRNVWDQIGAEPDTCNWRKCSHFQQCHFAKARSKAAEAQIIVVNHHLLFADLSKRAAEGNYTGTAVLPLYQHLIIDEAHNIEDVATDYFAKHVSRYEAARLMARIASDRHGRLTDLKKAIIDCIIKKRQNNPSSDLQRISLRLDTDLGAQKREINQRFGDTFQAFSNFITGIEEPASDVEQPPELADARLRVLPKHQQHTEWKEGIVPQVTELVNSIGHFTSGILSVVDEIEKLKDEDVKERCQSMCHDIKGLGIRLAGYGSILHEIAHTECPKERVRWIENQPNRGIPNVDLVDASLDIAEVLREYLFEVFPTVVMCSATLTVNREFQFLRKRLGISDPKVGVKEVQESCYDSPFDYEKQALLIVPNDIPAPSDIKFTDAATESILDAITASRGNALVLFTSYQMLKAVYQRLYPKMQSQRLIALKQGDDSRTTLLQRFRETDRSVLFATYSFWEGIDISGDALRCVVIVKLPFKVPSEPLIQARTESIAEKGGDPFMDYSLPLAIVKFKQGFGRLIRHQRDRGCIVCLDSRLINKRYGEKFLYSLPTCQRLFVPGSEMKTHMQEFYRKTHYLTLNR